MNILFLDIETTGLDPTKHTIIEISCRLDVNGKTISRFHTRFFNPDKAQIDLGALKVNKVTLKELIDLGISKEGKEDVGVVGLVDYLLNIKVEGPLVISGQNIQFDIKFIKALLEKYQIQGLDSIIGYKYLDTYSLAIGLIESGKLITPNGKTNLESLAEGLGINTENRQLHTATADVDLAAEIYYEMINRIKR